MKYVKHLVVAKINSIMWGQVLPGSGNATMDHFTAATYNTTIFDPLWFIPSSLKLLTSSLTLTRPKAANS